MKGFQKLKNVSKSPIIRRDEKAKGSEETKYSSELLNPVSLKEMISGLVP